MVNIIKTISENSKVTIYVGFITVGIVILLIAPDLSFRLFNSMVESFGGSYSVEQKELFLNGNYEAIIFIGKSFTVFGFVSLVIWRIEKIFKEKTE